MTNDLPSPDGHAQGWRLVSREALTEQSWIDASNAAPALLLVLDTQGDWWAVTPDCRNCATRLIDALRKDATSSGLDEFYCAQCGAAHGPGVADCDCVALMVVDEEIYAAPSIDTSDLAD